MNRLLALLKKEFIQMRRDRLTLVILLIMPVVQLIIYGFAINTDVKHLKTAVFDQSLSAESRELLNSFTASEYFDLIYIEDSFEDVNRRVDAGDAKVGVIIPPDLEENLKHNRQTPVQVIVDATDSQSAASAIAAAQSIGNLVNCFSCTYAGNKREPQRFFYNLRKFFKFHFMRQITYAPQSTAVSVIFHQRNGFLQAELFRKHIVNAAKHTVKACMRTVYGNAVFYAL